MTTLKEQANIISRFLRHIDNMGFSELLKNGKTFEVSQLARDIEMEEIGAYDMVADAMSKGTEI